METEAVSRGVARYHRLKDEAISRGDAAGLKPVERLLLYWFEPLVAAIKEEQLACRDGAPGKGRALYGPVIRSLDAERLAVIAMHQALGLTITEPTGVKVVSLTYAIGSSVVAEIHWDMLKIEAAATIKELEKKFKRLNTARRNWWAKKHLSDHIWNRRVCIHLGARLTQLLIGVANCSAGYDNKFVPAFRKHRVSERGDHRMSGYIRLTPEARDVVTEGHITREAMRPRYLPMLVPPYPWSKDHPGGYIYIRTPFISKPTQEQSDAIVAGSPDQVYESINALGAVPWRSNIPMIGIMETLWESGGNAAGLPPRDVRPMPPRPKDIDDNKESLKLWKAEATEVHQYNHRSSSRRVDFMSMLNTARMVGGKKFYLPHQICFRTRAYPIPVHFNHHGSDAPRSGMLFDRPVELSDAGWRQIQIHTANKFGMDKVSYEDRVLWVEDNMDHIITSAREGVDYEWWMQADDPLQFLAACKAMEDEEVAMRLPVHRDGTCNGLQHYAAESLNPSDCKAVNLAPDTKPNDVYIEVLAVVYDRIKFEADRGDELAIMTLPYLCRSTVKQPIMTTVYGVTRIGARSQIQDRLREYPGLSREDRFKVSDYLSHRVLGGLGEVCEGAGLIMEWTRESIKEILAAYPHETIRWTAASGFPVVQPYRNLRSCRVNTCLQEVTIAHEDIRMPAQVRRQVQGGPANTTHTDDATHMHWTNISCADEGIDFAEVHDSYWAHAENMPRVEVLLRENFVALHADSRYEAIHKEWQDLYPMAGISAPPPRGTFDLSSVLKSEYFFN